MPELRRDPLNNRWVVLAPERQRRPHFYAQLEQPEVADEQTDPFAAGHEHLTTPEVYALRPNGGEANGPGWAVRVVPNKYPALRVEGELAARELGPFEALPGVGAHEVLIETPDPRAELADLPAEHIAQVLEALRLRIEDLYRDRRIVHVLPFKNHGREAGATLPHSHSQIVGLPFVPARVVTQFDALQAHWNATGRSLFAEIVDTELQGERIVQASDGLLAFCPYASAYGFETHIVPQQLQADYRQAGALLPELAGVLKTVLLKWRRALGPVPYNAVLYTAPSDVSFTNAREQHPDIDAYYCWHLQLVPRLTRTGGFEEGSGSYINTVLPEEAAAALREVEVGA